MSHPRGPSWHAAENIRRWRGKESQELFARRVAGLGVPMNRSILANIELHRREELTVEEVFAFALALNMSPTNLVLPHDEATEVAVTPTTTEYPLFVRSWIYGQSRLPSTYGRDQEGNDRRLDHDFQRKAPEHELRQRDEAVQRHPLTMAITELQTLVRDSILGPKEQVEPALLAEGLRRAAKKVTTYAEMRAGDIEDRDTEKGSQS